MLWLNFLHYYQPPSSPAVNINDAVAKSYLRLNRILKQNPRCKFTVNIAGCLLEQLVEAGYQELIADWKELVNRGQLELTGSAKDHPLLPVWPASEISRQIRLNEAVIKKYFGQVKLTGFFLPEMAYSEAVAKIVKQLGYKWLILDEIALSNKLKNKIDYSQVYLDKASGLEIVWRNRKLSESYVPKEILKIVNQAKVIDDRVIVTATDAELYGLRHNDLAGSLEQLARAPRLNTELISQYLSRLNKVQTIKVFPASWQSTESELKNKQPYKLWRDPRNKIQARLWQLAVLAARILDRFPNDQNYCWARKHLDRGMASCAWWWASGYKFDHGEIAWNPEEIQRGAEQLTKSLRSLLSPGSLSSKLKAEKIYQEIIQTIWQRHWTKYWR